jgi:cytochrome c556
MKNLICYRLNNAVKVMMRKFVRVGLALSLASSLTTGALLAAPADGIRARVNGLRELGASYKTVTDGLRGGDIQLVLIRHAARQIRSAARAQYGWFTAGTGPQPGVRTAAKAEIWAKPAQFRAAQDAFARQAQVFERAAAGSDARVIRAEARKLGATCKACHDTFRVPKD